ncbi:MAG: hypothetical protein CSB48_05675 [Proteobacteria bacterium]|nr:MAG: hypothetical protein CSB48_05675 [Pseudomonadota bacterium]
MKKDVTSVMIDSIGRFCHVQQKTETDQAWLKRDGFEPVRQYLPGLLLPDLHGGFIAGALALK